MKIFISLLICVCANAGEVRFKASLSPAGSFTAKNKAVTGYAQSKNGVVSAKDVIIKMDQFKSGIALRDKHITERFKVKEFPEGRLISAQGKSGKGKAKIELMGIQEEVSGDYKVVGKNLIAQFPIKISRFKIEGVKYLGVGVKDEIDVEIELPLKP